MRGNLPVGLTEVVNRIHPVVLALLWVVAWLISAATAPILMAWLEMLGGVVWLFVALGLLGSAAGVLGVGAYQCVQARSFIRAVDRVLIPVVIMGAGAMASTQPAMELSWQAMHGRRDVPIWN